MAKNVLFKGERLPVSFNEERSSQVITSNTYGNRAHGERELKYFGDRSINK